MEDKPGKQEEDTFKLTMDKDFFTESYNNKLKVTIDQVISYLRHTEKLFREDPIKNPVSGLVTLRGLIVEGAIRQDLYESLYMVTNHPDAPYEINLTGDQLLIPDKEK